VKKEGKAMKTGWAALAVGFLAAAWARAAWEPVAAFSSETDVDTRTFSAGLPEEDGALDSRGFTVDWSDNDVTLNTKQIVGTMLLLK
jgi:hypothetical protein